MPEAQKMRVRRFNPDYEILNLGRVCTALLQKAAKEGVEDIVLNGEYDGEDSFVVTGIHFRNGFALQINLDPRELVSEHVEEVELG